MAAKTRQQYLEALNLGVDATEDDIRRAYKAEALRCHPDKNPDDCLATEKFQRLSEAYSYLLGSDIDHLSGNEEGCRSFFEEDEFLFELFMHMFAERNRGMPPFMHRPNFHPHFDEYYDDDEDDDDEECCCHHNHHHPHYTQQFTTAPPSKWQKKKEKKERQQARFREQAKLEAAEKERKERERHERMRRQKEHRESDSSSNNKASTVANEGKVDPPESSAPPPAPAVKKPSKKQLQAEQQRRQKEMDQIAKELEEKRQKEAEKELERQERQKKKEEEEKAKELESRKSAQGAHNTSGLAAHLLDLTKSKKQTKGDAQQKKGKGKKKNAGKNKENKSATNDNAESVSSAAGQPRSVPPPPCINGDDGWDSDGWDETPVSNASNAAAPVTATATGGFGSSFKPTQSGFGTASSAKGFGSSSNSKGFGSSSSNSRDSGAFSKGFGSSNRPNDNSRAKNSTMQSGNRLSFRNVANSSQNTWGKSSPDFSRPSAPNQPSASWVSLKHSTQHAGPIGDPWSSAQSTDEPANIWKERQDFFESALPSDAGEEDAMLQAAIELSRLQAKEDELARKLVEDEYLAKLAQETAPTPPPQNPLDAFSRDPQSFKQQPTVPETNSAFAAYIRPVTEPINTPLWPKTGKPNLTSEGFGEAASSPMGAAEFGKPLTTQTDSAAFSMSQSSHTGSTGFGQPHSAHASTKSFGKPLPAHAGAAAFDLPKPGTMDSTRFDQGQTTLPSTGFDQSELDPASGGFRLPTPTDIGSGFGRPKPPHADSRGSNQPQSTHDCPEFSHPLRENIGSDIQPQVPFSSVSEKPASAEQFTQRIGSNLAGLGRPQSSGFQQPITTSQAVDSSSLPPSGLPASRNSPGRPSFGKTRQEASDSYVTAKQNEPGKYGFSHPQTGDHFVANEPQKPVSGGFGFQSKGFTSPMSAPPLDQQSNTGLHRNQTYASGNDKNATSFMPSLHDHQSTLIGNEDWGDEETDTGEVKGYQDVVHNNEEDVEDSCSDVDEISAKPARSVPAVDPPNCNSISRAPATGDCDSVETLSSKVKMPDPLAKFGLSGVSGEVPADWGSETVGEPFDDDIDDWSAAAVKITEARPAAPRGVAGSSLPLVKGRGRGKADRTAQSARIDTHHRVDNDLQKPVKASNTRAKSYDIDIKPADTIQRPDTVIHNTPSDAVAPNPFFQQIEKVAKRGPVSTADKDVPSLVKQQGAGRGRGRRKHTNSESRVAEVPKASGLAMQGRTHIPAGTAMEQSKSSGMDVQKRMSASPGKVSDDYKHSSKPSKAVDGGQKHKSSSPGRSMDGIHKHKLPSPGRSPNDIPVQKPGSAATERAQVTGKAHDNVDGNISPPLELPNSHVTMPAAVPGAAAPLPEGTAALIPTLAALLANPQVVQQLQSSLQQPLGPLLQNVPSAPATTHSEQPCPGVPPVLAGEANTASHVMKNYGTTAPQIQKDFSTTAPQIQRSMGSMNPQVQKDVRAMNPQVHKDVSVEGMHPPGISQRTRPVAQEQLQKQLPQQQRQHQGPAASLPGVPQQSQNTQSAGANPALPNIPGLDISALSNIFNRVGPPGSTLAANQPGNIRLGSARSSVLTNPPASMPNAAVHLSGTSAHQPDAHKHLPSNEKPGNSAGLSRMPPGVSTQPGYPNQSGFVNQMQGGWDPQFGNMNTLPGGNQLTRNEKHIPNSGQQPESAAPSHSTASADSSKDNSGVLPQQGMSGLLSGGNQATGVSNMQANLNQHTGNNPMPSSASVLLGNANSMPANINQQSGNLNQLGMGMNPQAGNVNQLLSHLNNPVSGQNPLPNKMAQQKFGSDTFPRNIQSCDNAGRSDDDSRSSPVNQAAMGVNPDMMSQYQQQMPWMNPNLASMYSHMLSAMMPGLMMGNQSAASFSPASVGMPRMMTNLAMMNPSLFQPQNVPTGHGTGDSEYSMPPQRSALYDRANPAASQAPMPSQGMMNPANSTNTSNSQTMPNYNPFAPGGAGMMAQWPMMHPQPDGAMVNNVGMNQMPSFQNTNPSQLTGNQS